MIELKSCPFCGGEVKVYDHPVVMSASFVCERCNMETYFDYDNNIKEAIRRWNDRRERKEE